MFSAIFWFIAGVVVKTLVPMPFIDVFIRNVWAKLLGLEASVTTPAQPVNPVTPPVNSVTQPVTKN